MCPDPTSYSFHMLFLGKVPGQVESSTLLAQQVPHRQTLLHLYPLMKKLDLPLDTTK